MLFSKQISRDTMPNALAPYAMFLLCEGKTRLEEALLVQFLDMVRADVSSQRRAVTEAEPCVSADVLAAALLRAARAGLARHLLSEGLSVLTYYANHNARGGLFGLCGVEKANKIGYVPGDAYADAKAWTDAAAAVHETVAALAEHLGYDAEFVENYKRRAESASHNDIEPHAAL